MGSKRSDRFRAWFKSAERNTKESVSQEPHLSASVSMGPSPSPLTQLDNPVDNYYRNKVQSHLSVFYRFALQTRSLIVRNVFAKAASSENLSISELLTVIEKQFDEGTLDVQENGLAETFNAGVLLVLADLLANTARDGFDTYAAVQLYDFVYALYGDELFQDQHKLQYVEALAELESYDRVDSLAEEFAISDLAPLQLELLNVQRVRKTGTPNEWLIAMNELYTSLGLTQIELVDDKTLPLLDRLTAGPTEPQHGPKISVIVPTYSPGPGIYTAVRGLLQQSWQNIEIIIVNDASPSDYETIFSDLEQLQPKVRVLHLKENAGAYVARNAGLALATGEFITTHDDDDWSHPDKLAIQIRPMIADSKIVATTSGHIRTSQDMIFRRVNAQAKYLQMNYSSLMFRSSITKEIGNWDTVNRGGDSEFYTRLVEFVGDDKVIGLWSMPLSYSRVWHGSLTSGEMSRGFFAYSRLLYKWAFRQWHWDVKKLGGKGIKEADGRRPYAVPTTFDAGARNKPLGLFDVIYVTDVFRQSKYIDFVVKEIESLAQKGLRVGYMHLYSPETTKPAGISQKLFDLQINGQVTQVSHDDVAETRLLVVYDASIGMFLDQIKSKLVSQRSIVVNHELPILSGTEERSPIIFSQAIRNLDNCFATTFEIVGATPRDHFRIRESVPGQRVLHWEFIWNTHVSDDPGQIRPPLTKPIVGFHSYGNRYRWPTNVEQFEAVYLSSHFDTQFFGNLYSAQKKFGYELLENMVSKHEEYVDERDFLDSIDFWVYHPHDRLQDRVWEPVLAAMNAGKVVILPRRLSELYGGAAVYAEADQIDEVVIRLANDHEAYVAQAEAGLGFIKENYRSHHLASRVNFLINDGEESVS